MPGELSQTNYPQLAFFLCGAKQLWPVTEIAVYQKYK